MATPTVTVTVKLDVVAGQPGYATSELTAPLILPDGTWLSDAPVTWAADGTGLVTMLLPCTDTAGISPTGQGHEITVVDRGKSDDYGTVAVPYAQAGTTVALSTLTRIAAPSVAALVTGPAGPAGPTGPTGPTGPAGPSVYAAAVTDGTTDNYTLLNGLISGFGAAGGTILMPDTGEAAISNTLVLTAGVALVWPTPGPEFDSNAAITPIRGGLIPTAGFTGDSSGALVHMTGGWNAIVGGHLNAKSIAARAVHVDANDCKLDRCTLLGGTTGTLDSTANAARLRINPGTHINNVKNGSGAGTTAFAVNALGPDWVVNGLVKKGGSVIIGGSDYNWTGGHLTGATPSLATYPGANLVLKKEITMTGVILDSCATGASGFVWVDNAGGNAPATLNGCKFLQGSSGVTVPMIFHQNNNDMPVQLGAGTKIDANDGVSAFTSIIANPVPGDTVSPDVWASTNGLGAAPTLYAVGGSGKTGPSKGGPIVLAGARYPHSTVAATVNPVPSATASTFGTAVNWTIPNGFGPLGVLLISWTGGGNGTETVTIKVQATYDDGTTGSFQANTTATTAQNVSSNSMFGLYKNGHEIVALQVQSESSIASSTAAPAVNAVLESLCTA